MSPAQLNTLKSLPAQFVAVWRKLGGEYAEWGEADIHRLAWAAKITIVLRHRFDDYLSGEAQRAIAFYFAELSRFKALWTEKWTGEKAEREARQQSERDITATCLTYQQACEWIDEMHPYCKYPEWIEHVATINKISYYKPRSERLYLFTQEEARAEYRTFINCTRTFEEMYEPTRMIGWDGTLWMRTFKMKG